MDDCDWTDLPSTSVSAVVCIDDENFITDSSPEISEKKEDLAINVVEDDSTRTEKDEIANETGNKDVKKLLINKKQEKEPCPICLSSFEDRSFLDQCFHSFCFCCILQWCEVVQTCPLCKAGFASIIHNVKSMQDYEQYIVEKKKENEQSSNNVQVESSYDERGYHEHGQRFRYRTTRTERDNSDSTNTRSEIRQLRRSENTSRQRNEGWGSEARSRRRSRRTPLRIGGIEKRRQVYAFNLRATSTWGRGKQRSRNITSQFYKKFQGCTHRLIPWLARDLRVLLGNNEEEVNFLMEFILSLITRIDMDRAEFVEELRPFLLQTTEHFVHELLSFAKAPFDMATYDECVVYPWPEENSRAANYPNEHTVNEERQGPLSSVVSTQPVAERTPLSQCEWSETPAGLHQVFSLQDSPIQDGESLQPGDLHQVVEISDSTDSSEKTDDEDRKPTEHSQDIVVSEENVLLGDSSSRGLSKPDECQVITCASLTHGSSSEGVEMSRTEEKLLLTSHKNTADGDEHVHRHIHTHLHKHRHKHKHKHRHKLGHSHRLKRKRHPVNPESTSEYASSVGRALSSVSRSDTDISTTQTQVPIGDSGSVFETNSVGKAHSPKLEEMRKEIDELNVQIQQHEEQLLSLNRRTET